MEPKIIQQPIVTGIPTLRSQAEEALTYLDAKLAGETQLGLEKVLTALPQASKQAEEFKLTIAKLKFVRFYAISQPDLVELVEKYLPVCFGIENFDLKDKIGKRIVFIGEIEDQMAFIAELAKAFEKCSYRLGERSVVSGQRTYEPSIGNWIKLYLEQPSKSAARTNIEEWSFTEKNLPARYLEKPQREILLEILRIYDALKNRIYYYNSLPESDNEAEVFQDFDLYSSMPGLTNNQEDPDWKAKHGDTLAPAIDSQAEEFLNPDEQENSQDPEGPGKAKGPTYMTGQEFKIPESVLQKPSAGLVQPAQPVVPAPRDAFRLKPIEEITVQKPPVSGNAEIKLPPKPAPPAVVTKRPVISPLESKPLNIQDVLKNREQQLEQSGLKFGNGDAKPFAPSAQGQAQVQPEQKPGQDAQSEIDKKLQDLKKKIK